MRSYSDTCSGFRASGFANAPVRALNFAVYVNAAGVDGPATRVGSRNASSGSIPAASAAASTAARDEELVTPEAEALEDSANGFVHVVSFVRELKK